MSFMRRLTLVDPVVNNLMETIHLAQLHGAPRHVVDSMKSVLDIYINREKFTTESCTAASEQCQAIDDATYAHDWRAAARKGQTPGVFMPEMICGSAQGQFLKSLVSMQKAKRIVEVGTFTGYSALSMAEALPADGEIITLDICQYLKPFAEKLIKKSPHRNKIKIVIGNATEQMKQMLRAGQKFDMAFLDGDKEDYVEQLKILFDDNLLSPGGTVLVDNAYVLGSAYLYPNDKSNPARKLIRAIDQRPNLHKVMLPLNDGVLMIRRLSEVEGATS